MSVSDDVDPSLKKVGSEQAPKSTTLFVFGAVQTSRQPEKTTMVCIRETYFQMCNREESLF